MAYRKSLIVGLLVGLSAAPVTLRAVENPVWQAPKSNASAAPEISLQRPAALASSAPEAWKASEQIAPADIRFKKPTIAPADTTGAPIANTSSQSPRVVPAPSRPLLTSIPPAMIEITDAAPPAIRTPADQPASLLALLAPAVKQQTANQPAISHNSSAPVDQTAQQNDLPAPPQAAPAPPARALLEEIAPVTPLPTPISQASAQTADRPAGSLTDEQLQLVTRILSDSDVVRAPQEEPLPAADEADPFRRAPDSDGRNAGGPQHGDDMYYGDCCPPRPPLFWVAGVEATFLNPDLNGDRASWAVDDVIEDREEVYTTEDVDSVYLSPRIWIGVQGCTWGANLRYWHLNASESHFDPSVGADGTWDAFDCGRPDVGFFSMSRLEAYTIDLELTRRFCLHNCAMQGSVGIRHAEIDQADSITGTALSTDATLFGYAESDRYIRGTGLVFGWYGRKALFPCSCVHWYYNLRWSALWGPTQTAVETGATVLAPGANASSVNGAYTCVDDNLFIGEVQLGLEWNYALQCVPANAFFRAGIEYQRWSGGMGYSEAGSFAGIEVNNTFEQVGTTFASAAAPELDLIGLTLGTGLTW